MQSTWRRCVLLVRSGDPLGTLPPRIAPKSRCIWGAGTASCILQERDGAVPPFWPAQRGRAPRDRVPVDDLVMTDGGGRGDYYSDHPTRKPSSRPSNSRATVGQTEGIDWQTMPRRSTTLRRQD